MDAEARARDILMHYVKLWGEPANHRDFRYQSPRLPESIRIYKFRLKDGIDEWAFATVGMSQKALIHPSGAFDLRIELFLLCRPGEDQISDKLSQIAAYPLQLDTYFAEGHTVHGTPGHGIVDGSPLTDLVMTRADLGVVKDFVKHGDGTHTHLFWVVPISPKEREFAATQGWPALRGRFEARNTDVLDLTRLPVL